MYKTLLKNGLLKPKGKMKMNLQHFSDRTLYDLKMNMNTVGKQLQKIENDISVKAADPDQKIEDIQALQKSRDDMKLRFDVIKQQHDEMEAEERKQFQQKKQFEPSTDPKQQVTEAKASLFRSTVRQSPVSDDVKQALGDRTGEGGEKFLPKTVANDIIVEPFVTNQLRAISTLTNITNLEIPKQNFSLDDDDFVDDKETAKELKTTGDVVSFGRHKFKVFAGISETVLQGTHTNLVANVERALQSGVAAKEKKVAFTTSPKQGEEHMSFYRTGSTAIKRVKGKDMYHAIRRAIADLHEEYRENATIVMTYSDYSEIIESLANGSATLYAAQPEQVLGKPVVFSDSAENQSLGTSPIPITITTSGYCMTEIKT